MKRTIRRQQTIDAAERLERAIRTWVGGWRGEDEDNGNPRAGRYRTHLNAIDSVLGGAAAALVAEARALTTTSEAGLVYQQCREVDESVAWLYRLWDFYRLRLDQRRDPAVRATVIACDEIVWSAYEQVMASPAVRTAKISRGAAPLPYIHDDYSPAAIDQSRPLPPPLQMPLEFPSWDPALQAIVDRLAAPLLEAPRWCVGAPWWLVFVAHEVGHHLTARLELLDAIQTSMVEAVTPIAGADAAQAWASWSEEAVADAWSVALIGRAAVEALVEIELSEPSTMRRQSTREYPPAALRLALMARVCVALGFEAPAIPEVSRDAALQADADLAPLAAALSAVRGVLLGDLPRALGTIETLCAVNPEPFLTSVDTWSMRLRKGEKAAATSLVSARHLVAASFQAWQSCRADAEKLPTGKEDVAMARFAEATAALAKATTTRLAESGPAGTRAAVPQPGQPDADRQSAAALAQRLLALARQGVAPQGG
jgi:hypothetical protein